MCFALSGPAIGRYVWGTEKAENTEEMNKAILNSEISLGALG